MAQLPTVSPQSQQTGGFSAPNVTPMRSARGEQLQQLGGAAQDAALGVYQVGLQAQTDYDDARSTELTTKLANASRQAVDKFLQTTGRDTQAQRKGVIDQLESYYRELQRGVENPAQEAKFGPRAAQTLSNMIALVDDHEAKQTKVYRLAELDADAKEGQRQYLFWQRPGFEDKAAEAFNSSLDAVQKSLEMQGVGPESPIYKQRMLAASSALHGVVLKKLADEGKTQELKAYYETIDWQSELTADVKERTDAVLTEMQGRDEAVTAAMALDSLPYADRVRKLDEQLRSGVLNEKTYRLAIETVETREARAHRVEATKRSDMMVQVQSILDRDRQEADKTGAGQRSLDEVLPAPLLKQLDAAGMRGVAEQYATRGRRLTTPDGVAMLRQAQANPGSLRGVAWDVIAEATWTWLDEQDSDRLGAMWAAANGAAQPRRQSSSAAGDGANGLTVMNDNDFVESQLDRLLGPLSEKPTQEEINNRKRVRARLDDDLRKIAPLKPEMGGRDLLKQFVDAELVKQVQTKAGKVQPEYVTLPVLDSNGRIDTAASELTVLVPTPSGDTLPVSYADIRKPEITKLISQRLEDERQMALRAGDTQEAARIEAVIASRSDFEYAQAYGRWKLASMSREQIDAAKTAAATQAQLEQRTQQQEADIESAWRYYRGQSPASYNHPWWDSFRRWQFMGSERARRANAERSPRDSTFNFYQWHGLKDPAAEGAPLSSLESLLLDAAEVGAAFSGNLPKAEGLRDLRRKINDQAKPKKQ